MDSLWNRVMCEKYYPGQYIISWFQNPNKSHKNYSIGWKEMVSSFPFIGQWTSWIIENGKLVHIGIDPWVGVGENYKLSESLRFVLFEKHIHSIADVVEALPQAWGTPGWKNTNFLGL